MKGILILQRIIPNIFFVTPDHNEQDWSEIFARVIVAALWSDMHSWRLCAGESILDTNIDVSGWKNGNNIVIRNRVRLFRYYFSLAGTSKEHH